MASRRDILNLAGTGVVAAGGLALGAGGAAAQDTRAAMGAEIAAPNARVPQPVRDWRLPHRFGIGGVAIGNGMKPTTDQAAHDTLKTAWDAGIRFYDTAPFYGYGQSERRFGYFLHEKPREDYVLLSKVGRNLHPDAAAGRDWDDPVWKTPPNFSFGYDFSAGGTRRAVEQILQRMSLPYLDIVLVHDLDAHNEEIDWRARFEECKRGAFPELIRMREEGLIRAWGLGVNDIEPIVRCIRESDPDIHISAEQYSLIHHRDAVERLLPEIARSGNQLILGGVLNTGFLAGTPRYYYETANVTPQLLALRERARGVAQRHGVDLRTAALQFALAPSQVNCVLFGARSGQQVEENVASLGVEIPAAFWADLRRAGVIHARAATDYRRVSLST